MKPSVPGPGGSALTSTTRPGSTVTVRPHRSGQSSGHAEEWVSIVRNYTRIAGPRSGTDLGGRDRTPRRYSIRRFADTTAAPSTACGANTGAAGARFAGGPRGAAAGE